MGLSLYLPPPDAEVPTPAGRRCRSRAGAGACDRSTMLLDRAHRPPSHPRPTCPRSWLQASGFCSWRWVAASVELMAFDQSGGTAPAVPVRVLFWVAAFQQVVEVADLSQVVEAAGARSAGVGRALVAGGVPGRPSNGRRAGCSRVAMRPTGPRSPPYAWGLGFRISIGHGVPAHQSRQIPWSCMRTGAVRGSHPCAPLGVGNHGVVVPETRWVIVQGCAAGQQGGLDSIEQQRACTAAWCPRKDRWLYSKPWPHPHEFSATPGAHHDVDLTGVDGIAPSPLAQEPVRFPVGRGWPFGGLPAARACSTPWRRLNHCGPHLWPVGLLRTLLPAAATVRRVAGVRRAPRCCWWTTSRATSTNSSLTIDDAAGEARQGGPAAGSVPTRAEPGDRQGRRRRQSPGDRLSARADCRKTWSGTVRLLVLWAPRRRSTLTVGSRPGATMAKTCRSTTWLRRFGGGVRRAHRQGRGRLRAPRGEQRFC